MFCEVPSDQPPTHHLSLLVHGNGPRITAPECAEVDRHILRGSGPRQAERHDHDQTDDGKSPETCTTVLLVTCARSGSVCSPVTRSQSGRWIAPQNAHRVPFALPGRRHLPAFPT